MAGWMQVGRRQTLVPPQDAQVEGDQPKLSTDAHPRARITVLVVDDDPDQVDLLTRFLAPQGMVALPAYSGQQCLEMVRQRAIDIIVLNIVMPGMNGLEVCAALRKSATSRSTPIIVLTAKDDVDTRLAAMRLGVSEFVAKPTRGQNLLAHIRVQIGISRKTRRRKRIRTSKKPPKAKNS